MLQDGLHIQVLVEAASSPKAARPSESWRASDARRSWAIEWCIGVSAEVAQAKGKQQRPQLNRNRNVYKSFDVICMVGFYGELMVVYDACHR